MKNRILLFSFLLAATLIGCSNPQNRSAKATADAFLTALQAGDFDGAKAYCTESSRSKLALFETVAKTGANPFSADFSIDREEKTGDYAKVFYTSAGENGEKVVSLRNTTGKWEVMASKEDLSEGANSDDDMDLDLDEEDMEEFKEGLTEGLTEGLAGLKGGLEELGEGLSELGDGIGDDVEEGAKKMGLAARKFAAERVGKSEKDVAEAFLMALKYSDFDGAKKYASDKTADVLDMQSSFSEKGLNDFKVLRSKVEGKYASVFYEDLVTGEEKVLKLMRDAQDNWEVIMTKQDFND